MWPGKFSSELFRNKVHISIFLPNIWTAVKDAVQQNQKFREFQNVDNQAFGSHSSQPRDGIKLQILLSIWVSIDLK